MRKFLICILLLFMTASAKANTANIDPSLLPITPKQLNQALWANKNDADKLVVTIRQALENYHLEQVLRTLEYISGKEVALTGTCMVFDVFYWKSSQGIEKSPQDVAIIRKRLERAKELAPQLWFPYMVEGFGLVQDDSKSITAKEREKGINLLRKAVQLAPKNSYAQYALGQSYWLMSLRAPKDKKPNGLKTQWIRKAIYHLDESVQAKPALFNAAHSLFRIHDIIQPDRKKATEAGKMMQAMMPKDKKVVKRLQKQLAQYGIKVEAFKE
jgi:tetratricopeptide (TPR) repeat protein